MSDTSPEHPIRALYQALLDSWNRRNAADFAALFTTQGNIVGFDGSCSNGHSEIEAHLNAVFSHHQTPAFVGIVREVRFPAPQVALLRAVAGMVPAGQQDINPALNAVQSLLVRSDGGTWRIELFQNTPAAFHGRPELAEQLSAELQQALMQGP